MLPYIVAAAFAAVAWLQFGFHVVAPFKRRVWASKRRDWRSFFLFPGSFLVDKVGNNVEAFISDDAEYGYVVAVTWPFMLPWFLLMHVVGGIALVIYYAVCGGNFLVRGFFAGPTKVMAWVRKRRAATEHVRLPAQSAAAIPHPPAAVSPCYRDGDTALRELEFEENQVTEQMELLTQRAAAIRERLAKERARSSSAAPAVEVAAPVAITAKVFIRNPR